MKKRNKVLIVILVILSIITTSFIVTAETDIVNNSNELGMVDIIESEIELTPKPVLVDELTEEVVPEITSEPILTEELISEITSEITPETTSTEELTSEPILNLQSEEFVDLVIMKSGPIISENHQSVVDSIGGEESSYDIADIAYTEDGTFLGFNKDDTWNFYIDIEGGISLPYEIYSLPEPTQAPNSYGSEVPIHEDLHNNHPTSIPDAYVISSGGIDSNGSEFNLGMWQAIVIYNFPVGYYFDIYEKWDNSRLCTVRDALSIDKLTSYPKGYSSGYRIMPRYRGQNWNTYCITNLEGTTGVTETIDLKLSKILSVESFGKSEIFYFNIELTDVFNNSIPNGEYKYIKHLADGSVEEDKTLEIIDGKVTVKLKHNESIEILDLPLNTKYKITEINADDFVTQITVNGADYAFDINNSDKTVSGRLNDRSNSSTVDVVYTNALSFTLPDSGGNPYIWFIVSFVFIGVGIILLSKSRNFHM